MHRRRWASALRRRNRSARQRINFVYSPLIISSFNNRIPTGHKAVDTRHVAPPKWNTNDRSAPTRRSRAQPARLYIRQFVIAHQLAAGRKRAAHLQSLWQRSTSCYGNKLQISRRAAGHVRKRKRATASMYSLPWCSARKTVTSRSRVPVYKSRNHIRIQSGPRISKPIQS